MGRRGRPRAIRVALALLLLALAGAWWGWTSAWPAYRPALGPGESFAIDVSAYQGHVDWPAVATDGIRAAYLKASEGASWVDPTFAVNWEGARAAGLVVGVYHFFTLCAPGTAQADNLLAQLGAVSTAGRTLPVAVDLEYAGQCAARPAPDALTGELRAFVERVEARTEQRVILYVEGDFAEAYPLPPDLARERWERRLFLRPAQPWVWWQVNNRARVSGIGGQVDLDVARLDG